MKKPSVFPLNQLKEISRVSWLTANVLLSIIIITCFTSVHFISFFCDFVFRNIISTFFRYAYVYVHTGCCTSDKMIKGGGGGLFI